MEPNQRQSIVFTNANVTVEDILQIHPTKPIDSIKFTKCNNINAWAPIISAIAKLPLRALSFKNCNLNSITSTRQSLAELALSKLKKISSLTIYGCNLNKQTISTISQLTNLTELNIGHERAIQSYDDIRVLVNLRKLKSHAFNTSQFKSIQKLQNLTKLKVSGGFEGEQWFSSICSLRNLRQLIIQWQFEDTLPIPVKYIYEIRNLKYLKKLVIRSKSRNSKRYLFDLKFANAISTLPDVTDLELCHHQFGDDGLEELSKMKSLQVFKLDHNRHITKHGLALLSNLLNLQQLSFQNESYISLSAIDAAGAAHLSKLVNLKKLHLNNNKIGDAGAKHISKMHSLRELYINDNGITDQGAAALCRIPNLEVLSLNINKIGNDSVQELSKLAKLRQISLYYCQFKTVDRLYKVASLRQLAFSSCVDVDRVRVCHIKKPQLEVHIGEFWSR